MLFAACDLFHPVHLLSPDGDLWTAKWWTLGDVPGGAGEYHNNNWNIVTHDSALAGVWTDNGKC